MGDRGGTLTDAHHHLLAEWDWQRDRLPEDVRQLVIDDERQRDDMCWNVFRVRSTIKSAIIVG